MRAPQSTVQPSENTRTTNQARILVVDDEPMVRSVIARLLGLKGHTIVQAASGAEALDIVQDQAFDIVFTDLAMPEMNGRQLAHAIRQQHETLPIVLISGDTELGAINQDINYVMPKPFKLNDLEAAIQELLA